MMTDEHTFEVTTTWQVTHTRQVTSSERPWTPLYRDIEERVCVELIADGIIADRSEFRFLRDQRHFSMTLREVE